MHEATPSRTALSVALRRAAHQLFDKPLVLEDPIAVLILGASHAEQLRRTPLRTDRPFSVATRAHVVARSRYAEDNLRLAVERGVRQYVLLGAGLDTFAYRNPYPELRVFEIDHPATQQWKRQLLTTSSIAIPESLTYVPVDFERESLPERLLASGFDPSVPAFFGWLGVVPYLTLSAFRATVSFIAARPQGSGVVFDYGQPREALPLLERLGHDSLAARVQIAGEPFQLFFMPVQVAAELSGFAGIEDLGSEEVNQRYFSGRRDELRARGKGGRLLSAWV
jgi:methyltransferase (TIGR00027 family)